MFEVAYVEHGQCKLQETEVAGAVGQALVASFTVLGLVIGAEAGIKRSIPDRGAVVLS